MPKMVEVTCVTCRNVFWKIKKHFDYCVRRGQSNFYCSNACAHRGEASILDCGTCGKKIRVLASARRSKSGLYFCSKRCAAITNNTAYRSGENNPNWANGKHSYRERMLGDKCEDCGESRYYLLVVHHKNGDRERNQSDDLVTLCHNCHVMRHLVPKDGLLVLRWNVLTSEEAKRLM